MDVGPLEPCPYRKSGQHRLAVVVPGEDEGDLTLFCDACGTVRRIPASGSLPLDSATASILKSLMKE